MANQVDHPVKLPLPQEPWLLEHLPQTTELDIFYCFRLLLRRVPTREELPGHLGRVGEDLSITLQTYLESLEFKLKTHKFTQSSILEDIERYDAGKFKLMVPVNDPAVGKWILINQGHESHVTKQFEKLLQPGMAMLDIGANIGWFTMLAAALVGPTGYVMAIEPSAENMKLLEASRRLNQFDQITPVQGGADYKTGLSSIFNVGTSGVTADLLNDTNWILSAQTTACFRVDDIFPKDRKLDLIKIDIDGAEHRAMTGCVELIRRHQPTIITEFCPKALQARSNCSPEEYLQMFIDLGYKLSVIELDGKTRGTNKEEIMTAYQLSGLDHIDLLMVRG